ncbi:hypothetical protein RclHR1_03560018 [Rhizophagus clarus]|uniref:Crinkler effector protein N-terminal domain-containing protein n=1 Tax=Rhizophagus clarus TaxID=94130 RepID=A0A2Z6RBQ2_9GLOM|nr:hypothetical protein RclHR1_03560018 [Rhizophagus clarus]GET01440.1 hypothetical protein RCL_jg11007.t1 [Rhizophagus clarus]
MFTITLSCLVIGDSTKRAFSIEIDKDKCVDHLKFMIKTKKHPRFDTISSDELDIWKVDVPLDKLNDKISPTNIKTMLSGEELSPLSKIGDVFSDNLAENNINVLVQFPDDVQKDYKSIIERINSLEVKLAQLQNSLESKS